MELAAFTSKIKSLHTKDGRAVLVATKAEGIFEVHATASKPVHLVKAQGRGELCGMAVHPSESLLTLGSDDGLLRVWDYNKKVPVLEKSVQHPISALAYSPDGMLLACSFRVKEDSREAGVVCVINMLTLQTISEDNRPDGPINDLKFSPDGNVLVACSMDKGIYVFESGVGRKGYAYRCTCKGHRAAPSHVDFSEDGRYLQSNSENFELMYWNVANGKQLMHGAIELRDTKWRTWTCPMGWPVREEGFCLP